MKLGQPTLLPKKAEIGPDFNDWHKGATRTRRHSTRRRWPFGHRYCSRRRQDTRPTSAIGPERHNSPAHDTVPEGAGRSDTESASGEDTKSGRPQTSLDIEQHNPGPHVASWGRLPVLNAWPRTARSVLGPTSTRTTRRNYRPTQPRTARSVLGPTACVERLAPDRA